MAHNIRERRQILGISQAKLAEKINTSAHYIGQIELENKFPTPEMLERIALALEIDSPQLFSMTSFPREVIKQFQKEVLDELGVAITNAIDTRMSNLEKLG